MRSRLLVFAGVIALALGWTGVANAGYAISPPSGSTTTSQPTFEVYLNPDEALSAEVYVASDTSMGSYYIPTNEVGSCMPSTPTTDTNHYTCTPSYYTTSSGTTSSLPPGTYYWWLTFWHTDPSTFITSLQISGPLQFTVPAPVAPSNTYLVSPADGAAVTSPVTFKISAPAQATMHIYVSDSSSTLSDGSPAGLSDYSCDGQTTGAGIYYCTDSTSDVDFSPGTTYYWWAVIDVGANGWIYGPRTFTIRAAATGATGGAGSSSGAGSTGSKTTHSLSYAPYLPRATRYTGTSIKDTLLSAAVYKLTKFVGAPKTVAVACWSSDDWVTVSADIGYTDATYSLLGFYTDLMPHWVQLSPDVCRGIETLVHHRPLYPNAITADAVETLTHETMHAIGITRSRYGNDAEAMAECYGMQLSIVLAVELGVPYQYANGLAKFNLLNYQTRPPNYRNYAKCREDGAWDLFPGHPSPPWHSYAP